MKKHIFRLHAVKRMHERSINRLEVLEVISSGDMIESYEDDLPYPSKLVLKVVDRRPIHVVYAESPEEKIVITVYEPSPERWEADFKTRKLT